MLDNRTHAKALDDCFFCVEGARCEKHLLISLGTTGKTIWLVFLL